MSTLSVIIVVIAMTTTYTMIFSIITKIQDERERVRRGFAPLNDYEYLYLLVPYVVSTATLLFLAYMFRNVSIVDSKSLFGVVIASIVILVAHTLLSILGTALTAVYSSIKAKKN